MHVSKRAKPFKSTPVSTHLFMRSSETQPFLSSSFKDVA
jgi:hypothetical protein